MTADTHTTNHNRDRSHRPVTSASRSTAVLAAIVALLTAGASAGAPTDGGLQPSETDQAAADVTERPSEDRLPSQQCVPIPTIRDRCEAWVTEDEGYQYGPATMSPDGQRVFVTGMGYDPARGLAGLGGSITWAYDVATGQRLWMDGYDGNHHSDSAVSPDGGTLYVTGVREPGERVTIAYDAATGERRWEAADLESPRYDRPSVAVDPGGERVYVTGASAESPRTGTDYLTVAYDAATGAQLWQARYAGPGDSADEPEPQSKGAIKVSPDGRQVLVTGYSRGANAPATVAYDAATGEQRWVARGNQDLGFRIRGTAMSPGGDLLYVMVYDNSDGRAWNVVAYDTDTGEQTWLSRYDDVQVQPYDVAVNPRTGQVYVTGLARFPDTDGYPHDPFTVAYDGDTGEQAWTARHDGVVDFSASGYGVTAGPDGDRVYVVGSSASSSPRGDAMTIAYDADTGELAWTARYNHGQPDETAQQASMPAGTSWNMGFTPMATPDGGRLIVAASFADQVAGVMGEQPFHSGLLAYDLD